jgi:hypothetical protein
MGDDVEPEPDSVEVALSCEARALVDTVAAAKTLLRCSRDPSVDINRGRGSSYAAGSVRGDVGENADTIDRVWWDRHDDSSESGGFWEVPCDSSVEVEL